MDPITYIDRTTGNIEQEQVYGAKALNLLYGKGWLTSLIGVPLAHLCARLPFFSAFFGYLKTRPSSAKQIIPFINNFGMDTSEFLESPKSFKTFNDFFIRKLKPAARPIAPGNETAIIPADGRYWFYQRYDLAEGIIVKGQRFDIPTLIGNKELAEHYSQGSLVVARLCPTDYHRFHFPCDCIPGETQLINGWLYSVNPIAIKKDLQIFTQNKRTLCELETEHFGKVLFLEIGATCVGAIHQTYSQDKHYNKGDEKGYFSFGASSLILLFPPNKIIFDKDLIDATKRGLEIRCLMGQSMGQAVS